MSTDTSAVPLVRQRRAADAATLTRFAVVALPTGWVLLTLPLVLHQPFEPFVLATLVLGLLDLRGGGSILLVAVVHATFNAAALFVNPQQDWIRYVVIVGLGTLAAAGARLTRGRRL